MTDATTPGGATRLVYWHRDLPPLTATAVEEHTLEATSRRVAGSLERHDDQWRACYEDLKATAEVRLEQELRRLGGDYVHVFDEWVDSRRDDAAGEAWLQGTFKYTLYRDAPNAP